MVRIRVISESTKSEVLDYWGSIFKIASDIDELISSEFSDPSQTPLNDFLTLNITQLFNIVFVLYNKSSRR